MASELDLIDEEDSGGIIGAEGLQGEKGLSPLSREPRIRQNLPGTSDTEGQHKLVDDTEVQRQLRGALARSSLLEQHNSQLQREKSEQARKIKKLEQKLAYLRRKMALGKKKHKVGLRKQALQRQQQQQQQAHPVI